MKDESEPSLKNLTSIDFGKPPNEQNKLLQELGAPHTNSFDFLVDDGLRLAIADLDPIEFNLPQQNNTDMEKQRIKMAIVDATLGYPMIPYGTSGVKHSTVMPNECRQRHATYKGRLVGRIAWSINGVEQPQLEKFFGEIPIMVKSNRCHLSKMTPAQLVEHGEHEQEWGGYFIIKGLERLVRMLLMTRRNYPIAICRSGWKQRGPLFSDMGVIMRCVKEDETSVNNVLHYVTDGTVKVMFSHRKILYYANLVLLLKCLCDYTDKYVYAVLTHGLEDNLHYCGAIQTMIRAVHEQNLHTQAECKAYLGKLFRVKFEYDISHGGGGGGTTDADITDYIITHCLLIHLPDNDAKFAMFAHMTQKVYAFAGGRCKAEGVDAVMMQELLLGGHLYLSVLKERLQSWLGVMKMVVLKKAAGGGGAGAGYYKLTLDEMKMLTQKTGGSTTALEAAMENFLATGNLSTRSTGGPAGGGGGLMQDKGLTILPENINRMRYMSHFRSVHRGAFFQEMRTTEVRQLLPDAWGFICPVHTPDGSPCGLLNHLTQNCVVTTYADRKKVGAIEGVLINMGVRRFVGGGGGVGGKRGYCVVLDGRYLGTIAGGVCAQKMVDQLRMLKIEGEVIPASMEIVLVPQRNDDDDGVVGQYPGVYMFTGPARMMRPLINLRAGRVELVGTFEQVYMDVCVRLEEAQECTTTHMELSAIAFLSNLAQLIPMPDCNQSPRNMYQCQMGKQTMGTPTHMWELQAETKLYRLQTPATPLFRPAHYDAIQLDDFAMGTNAIVAVISYTGYDMEDAMIINKSSYERGFAHGSVYKSEFVELNTSASYFCRDPSQNALAAYLDTDGLPYVGRQLKRDEPLYCYMDADIDQYHVVYAKIGVQEEIYVNRVRLCGDFNVKRPRVACLSYRLPRNPTVGDKFASRAGQKGICSQRWPAIDLPFTESGLVPDVVFNPHGFPSRMTIAMMIELMAGKSAALHGLVHDATPFKFDERDTAIAYFGRLLEAADYDYYGTETMYSGIDGREMRARIFFGVVHYQRLRHMVSDKFQVRSTGPIDITTRQPLKGRKRGGGVRFGEMERDGLISHGSSFLLQDRMLHCTDKAATQVCVKCNTLIGLVTIVTNKSDKLHHSETKELCQLCQSSEHVFDIQVPYIYKFFAAQMAACNVIVKFHDKQV